MGTGSKWGSDRPDGAKRRTACPDRLRPSSRPLWAGAIFWVSVAAAVTALLWSALAFLDKAHMALGYLLVVLAGSAREGRVVGLLLSLVCFLAFNFFLLSPLYTFAIHDPLDWWVLGAFLITGLVAAQLFHESRRAAALAERVEALREGDRVKDALLASVSHDLRTPLTSIRATAAELRGSGEERAAIIEEEADRLNRLVTDLLDMSRIRAGALPLSQEVHAAEDLLGAALSQLRGVAGEDRVRVRLPPGEVLPLGSFDFVHALRALSNILENALRHTRPTHPVEVEVETVGPDLVFRVMDRGSGVRYEDRERIFEPFFRSLAPSSDARGGTGLGLAIARELAEMQGGGVRHLPRPGGGSIFELRFPSA